MKLYSFCFSVIFLFNQQEVESSLSVDGPSLTLTLKDLSQTEEQDSLVAAVRHMSKKGDAMLQSSSSSSLNKLFRVLSLSGLRPSLKWGMKSLGTPFPEYMPAVKSLSFFTEYDYSNGDVVGKSPLSLQGHVELGKFFRGNANVQLRPRYFFKHREADLTIAIGGEATNSRDLLDTSSTIIPRTSDISFFSFARFSSKRRKLLDFVSFTYKNSLPFRTLGSFMMTPSFDFKRRLPSCVLAGESGTGRTTAILDLNIDSPTLMVVHDIDSRNTISPEISLSTAQIMYNWYVTLKGGGTIHTRIDPTKEIHVTWTDLTFEGGNWVTDFRLPLQSGDSPLAMDVKVRRRFVF